MKTLACVAALAICLPRAALAQDEAFLSRPPGRDAVASLTRLRDRSDDPVEVRWGRAGTVRSLGGRFELSTEGDLASACLEFFDDHAQLFSDTSDLNLELSSERRGMGSKHLRFRSTLGGVPVAGGEIAFHVQNSQGDGRQLIAVDSNLPSLQAVTSLLATPGALDASVSSDDAVRLARVAVPGALRSTPRTRLEILTSTLPARLAYAIDLSTASPSTDLLVHVDAKDGTFLGAWDRRRFVRNGTGRVFIVNPVVDLKDSSLRDQDDAREAVPEEAYTEVTLPDLDESGFLVGPYVSTIQTPDAVRRVRLDYPLTRDQDGFEEVMIYYHVDAVQRFIQSLGFDTIYNRQISAFANSEPPGLPFTDAQAYFLPDFVQPGVGVLAFGSGGADSGEDAEVIVHEYGHAVQNNQAPGFGDFFLNPEGPAVGEGWADFFAASYLSAFSDGFGDTCVADWWTPNVPDDLLQSAGECLRDLGSRKHYPESLSGFPHLDGEMWSAALWQIHEEIGREDVLSLTLQANFFMGPRVGFRDAAEAVQRADQTMFGGQNAALIERVFTERGFLVDPPSLDWFYTTVPANRAVVTNSLREFKLLVDRPGTLTSGDRFRAYVNIRHPNPGELNFELRSPAGTRVLLNASFLRSLTSGPVVFGGVLPPLEPFSNLEGEPLAGVWSLEVSNFPFFEDRMAFVDEWGVRFAGFIRGDADQNGELSLNDTMSLLQYLFVDGQLVCEKAGDFDDDGRLDLSDALRIILFLFGGQAAPAEPYPDPGEDLTMDSLSCDI